MSTSARRVAAELDASDPLAPYRDRFLPADDVVAYLDGNSLGRTPRATAERLASFVTDEWARRLIRGWDEGWLDLPVDVGDELGAAVLGAAAGQTLVADSTTVNLFKVLHAACGLRPGRDEIVASAADFPTDRYVVEQVAAQRSMTVRWLQPDLVENVTPDVLGEVLGERTAVVSLSHVDYRSSALLDLPALTEQIHDSGALAVWDLCHSAGVVPTNLDEAGVDLAVGCTYKFLNAGPGAPAFLYVAREHLATADQPIMGWFSAADLFEMADAYRAATDVRRMLSGTPNVLGIVAVQCGVQLVAEAGIDAVRAKSTRLTSYLIDLLDEAGATVLSPRAADRRGSHVSIQVPDAAEAGRRLVEAGVIPDVRRPDLLRLGLSPLSTSFAEVLDGFDVLRSVVLPS
ncbi:kynureninase [Aeromicrobium terrae]|uniref:Kynureninase n=1 Tax=Aeromicrobium terrae TaxID=2498846 RepID=A0A5C8NPR3_9ACTN|nr:kynureninase [Aeromicrobium terrae]TXL63292.1 kynureninase [Aeromicrobium terrae]